MLDTILSSLHTLVQTIIDPLIVIGHAVWDFILQMLALAHINL